MRSFSAFFRDVFIELFGDGSTTEVSLSLVVWAIACGLIVASVWYWLTSRALGSLFRALTEGGIRTRESAMTLEELGVRFLPLVRYALRRGTTLSRIVRCANEAEADESVPRAAASERTLRRIFSMAERAPTRRNYRVARFYLPPESETYAKVRAGRAGNGVIMLILSILMIIALAAAVDLSLPYLVQITANAFS